MFHALVFSAAVVSVLSPYGLFRSHTPEPQKACTAKVLSEKEMKEKIDKIKRQITRFNCYSIDVWKEARAEIMHAVAHDGIHPDQLNAHSWNILAYAVFHNDFGCANLLIARGANLNLPPDSFFYNVQSVRMAQLLFDHGARFSNGPLLLYRVIETRNHYRDNRWRAPEPELIEWYAHHGVDPNQSFDKKDTGGLDDQATPLQLTLVAFDRYYKDNEPYILKRISLLMQLGAPLAPLLKSWSYSLKNHNTPQCVKQLLHEKRAQKDEAPKVAMLSEARKIMIAASNYRHDGLKADLSRALPIGELFALTASYYVVQEPRYEELEAMPLPSQSASDPKVH